MDKPNFLDRLKLTWLKRLLCFILGHKWQRDFWQTQCRRCCKIKQDRLYQGIEGGTETYNECRFMMKFFGVLEDEFEKETGVEALKDWYAYERFLERKLYHG